MLKHIKDYYDANFLPILVDKICSGSDFMTLREAKLKQMSGVGLELGVGGGLNLKYYSKKVSKLYIIEPCEKSLSRAIEVAADCSFEVIPIYYGQEGNIPLADEELDFVNSTWTMCTIPDIHTVLLEVKRLLKENGKLYFLEHGLSPDRNIARVQNILNPVQKTLGGGCHLNRKIDKIIEDAGYEIKEIKNFYMSGLKFGGYQYSGYASKR